MIKIETKNLKRVIAAEVPAEVMTIREAEELAEEGYECELNGGTVRIYEYVA